LLEEGQQYSSSDPVEAHPQLLPWTLSFKKIQEDIHRWRMAKVIAKDGEGPNECPVVGV